MFKLPNLKKHHFLILSCAVVFVIAWAIWTFIWLPQADVQAIDPGAAAPPAVTN